MFILVSVLLMAIRVEAQTWLWSGQLGTNKTDSVQGPTGIILAGMTQMPGDPSVPVLPGVTWYFQCWCRDSNPGQASNFTHAISITLD